MATKKQALPGLPKSVFSVLGDVPVFLDQKIDYTESAMGLIEGRQRRITISPNQTDIAGWATLFHEMTHLAMWDSGVHNTLTKDQAEAVCDALGTYLAAAMQAGRLILKDR